eukprot:1191202-Prorocentrum_minimum.AAC.9
MERERSMSADCIGAGTPSSSPLVSRPPAAPPRAPSISVPRVRASATLTTSFSTSGRSWLSSSSASTKSTIGLIT